MYEKTHGARRLANAIWNRSGDPAFIKNLARLLDYEPKQLEEDAEALREFCTQTQPNEDEKDGQTGAKVDNARTVGTLPVEQIGAALGSSAGGSDWPEDNENETFGTDWQTGRHDEEVINGLGFYDASGHFYRYKIPNDEL